MKKILLIVVSFLFISLFADSAEKLTSQQFLNLSRKAPPQESWGIMSGEAMHRRNGEAVETFPIRLAVKFTPINALSQVIIANKEGYQIAQEYNSKAPTVFSMSLEKNLNLLGGKLGIKPEDLTMSFLHWNFKEELEETSHKTLSCRVFILESFDKKERVKVALSTKYFFPLKVEWYKTGEKIKFRTLEVKSFKNMNDLGIIASIKLYGPGWVTKINFEDIDADVTKKRDPKNLFKKTIGE